MLHIRRRPGSARSRGGAGAEAQRRATGALHRAALHGSPRGGRSPRRGEQRRGPVPSVAGAMGGMPGHSLVSARRREQQQPPCRGPGPGPGGVWLAWRHGAAARSGIPDGPSARNGLRARRARARQNRCFGTSSPAGTPSTVPPPALENAGGTHAPRREKAAAGPPTRVGAPRCYPGFSRGRLVPRRCSRCLNTARTFAACRGRIRPTSAGHERRFPSWGCRGNGELLGPGRTPRRSPPRYRGGGGRGARPGRGERLGGKHSSGTCRRVSAPRCGLRGFPNPADLGSPGY